MLVTTSQPTLAMPAEVQRIGTWPPLDIGGMVRRWAPSLLVSVCVNLLLLYWFPLWLQPDAVPADPPPLQVRLTQISPAVSEPQPIQPPARTPTPPPRIEPKPRQPAPQPPTEKVIAEPAIIVEPQPAPVVEPPPQPEPVPIKAVPPPPKPQPLYKLTRMPELILRTSPAYPESERAAGREPNVLAEVFIDAMGRVLDVTIVKSGGAAFDQAVVDTLKSSRFTPGYIDEEPVAVRFQIPFRFRLN